MSLGKNKKAVRRGNRAFVTKIIQTTNEAIDGFGGTQHEKDLLQGYKITLVDKKEALKKLDEAVLEELEDEDKIVEEVFDASEVGESINRTLAKIDNVIKLMEASQVSTPEIMSPSHSSEASQSVHPQFKARSKLPKLSLKRFSGNPTNWQSFWDSYTAAVHSNETISKVDKFNYLKSLLEGPAASAIAGFALTDENYEAAIRHLTDRFANPQVIVTSHMDALLKLEPVSNILEVGQIRKLYDSIETHIRSLSNLKIPSESYGTLLIPMILAKIPDEMQLLISRKVGKDNWKIDNLLEEFKVELEARERCSLLSTSTQSKRDGAKRFVPHTSSALLSGNAGFYTTQTCTFCGQQHLSSKCNIVTDVSVRRTILRKKGKCFACLKSGHIIRDCPSKFRCLKCGNHHHISLCEFAKKKDDSTKVVKNKDSCAEKGDGEGKSSQSSEDKTTTTLCSNSSTSVLLQTASAMVGNPNNPDKQKIQARIVFDSCSQRSYISHHLQKSLQLLPVNEQSLLVKTFGNDSPKLMTCDLVQVSITATDGLELYVNAFSTPVICSPVSNQAVEVAVERYPYLQDLELADEINSSHDVDIDILIGADFYWNFVSNESRRGEQAGPVALLTRLGWVLSGPVSDSCDESHCTTNLNATHVLRIEATPVQQDLNTNMNEQLKKFWDLETVGIHCHESSVYDKFVEDVQFDGERYEAKLPFKEHHSLLPDNYAGSVKRLGSLIHRLQNQPSLLHEYNKIIQDQIQEGIVEPVDPEARVKPGNVHYLPHREVVRADKNTTKVRVVYDASAKTTGPSLNDCLYAGPSLTPLIFDILLRFRVHRVAMLADIEKAFLNISIAQEHRDFLRFLWVDDPNSTSPTVQPFRFTRVVFGVTSSPFILNATLRYHMNRYLAEDPEFVQEVLRSLYVDDYASGSTSVPSALELAKKVKRRLSCGGFNMRKWQTNSKSLRQVFQGDQEFVEGSSSPELASSVKEEDRGYTKSVLGDHHEVKNKVHVLGQTWNTCNDKFEINMSKIVAGHDRNVCTKRTVLSVSAKFYDPLGLISPVVLQLKLLFQELCGNNVERDDQLSENFCLRWNSIISCLKKTEVISVDRCYFAKEPTGQVQLHAFADASETSYGACVYLRYEHEAGVHCNLVASKTRVAPTNKQSIPRLELLSCLVSARLVESIKKALQDVMKIDTIVFWSDSTVAIQWIRSVHKEYKQFVENRVQEVRRLSDPKYWRYCPTKENPADTASRGESAKKLVANDKWWHGPKFLEQHKESWPEQPFSEANDSPDTLRELKPCEHKLTLAVVGVEVQHHNLGKLLDPSKYSKIETLLRVTAYIQRFITNLKRRLKGLDMIQGPLTAEELDVAEKSWIKQVQAALPRLSRYQKMKQSLRLFEDDEQIIRCHGRIERSSLPQETKFPILLSGEHPFTKLVVLRCHREVMHDGVGETLTQLRSRFWVVKGRQVVKKIVYRCTTCRRWEGKSYAVPPAPPLPEYRLDNTAAFTRVGVDYAGPLFVRNIYPSDENMHKAYIVLYTCASSRAVHLDLVPDATSEAFIRSFKRFMSRRGVPATMISDNGKTFKAKELKEFTASKRIKWVHIVARSPWWGGFYERLVRSVKRCLKKVLRTAKLTYEELLTLLIQVEGVMNSRPLTYVYEDNEPLTPSHLVLGRRVLSQAKEIDVNETDHAESSEKATRRQKHLKTVLLQFWRRWQREYLTQLREYHRPKEALGPPVNVGDVVTIQEDNIKRLNWNIGRVEKLLTGRDGNTRAVVLRAISKDGKPREMKRSIQRLYPVELKSDRNDIQIPITFVEHANQEN